MSRTNLVVAILLAMALIVAACSTDSDGTGVATEASPTAVAPAPVAPTATAAPSTPIPPTATAVPPTPTAVPPTPTAIPPTPIPPTPTVIPTATPEPEPTVVDTTPVVIEGDDWVITQGEIDELFGFIEDTHELNFDGEVRVLVSPDIGLEFAPEFEAFAEDEWILLTALGLAGSLEDREATNQARRDRIRGVCCQDDGQLQVVVEIEATKLETSTIVVHELTHALHRQNQDSLFANTQFLRDETPAPYLAVTEGVPQFVSFAHLALGPLEERIEVVAELPIIRDDMIPLVGSGPARHLNFAYSTGPDFVNAVVASRGVQALAEMLGSPPTTTEQILFPEKYLAGEGAAQVESPQVPAGFEALTTGRIGSAMLMFVLAETEGDVVARQMVEPWAGDQYVTYRSGDQVCLVAHIAMDDIGQQLVMAELLASNLVTRYPDVETVVTDPYLALTTCSSTG